METAAFTIDCTGDVVAGDTILFTEGVFSGFCGRSRFGSSKPKRLGDRTIVAEVLRDSYGAGKQQHTFTIRVLACEGYAALAVNSETTRKGRNIYRNETSRLPWADESERAAVADDKHARGDKAREVRAMRRAEEEARQDSYRVHR